MCILFVVFWLSVLLGAITGAVTGFDHGLLAAMVGLIVGLVLGGVIGGIGSIIPLGISIELISLTAQHSLETSAGRDEGSPCMDLAGVLVLFPAIVLYLTVLSLLVIGGAMYASYWAVSWLTSNW
jgi:hypothetical protein